MHETTNAALKTVESLKLLLTRTTDKPKLAAAKTESAIPIMQFTRELYSAIVLVCVLRFDVPEAEPLRAMMEKVKSLFESAIWWLLQCAIQSSLCVVRGEQELQLQQTSL